MPENPKKLMSFTPRMLEMISSLRAKRGLMTDQEVIRFAISDMYGRAFPAYSTAPKKRLTPEQQIKAEGQKKEAQQEMLTEEKKAICEKLGGNLEKDGENTVCHYYTYSMKKRYLQEVSLEMLDDDMIKTQYQPNKQKVLALQKAKKVDY